MDLHDTVWVPVTIPADSSYIRNGLVLFYDFNEDLKDHSGNHNDIIQSNFKFNTELKSKNRFVYFDGNSTFGIINNSATLNPENAMSIAFWIKPIDYTGLGTEPIVLKPYTSHTSPYYQYLLGIAGNYGAAPYNFTFDLCINGEYLGINSGAYTWEAGQWYFVVATYDGLSLKLFVNGTQKKSLSAPGTITTFDTDLYLGKQANFYDYSLGYVDNIRIYNRALTNSEVTVLYNATAK